MTTQNPAPIDQAEHGVQPHHLAIFDQAFAAGDVGGILVAPTIARAAPKSRQRCGTIEAEAVRYIERG